MCSNLLHLIEANEAGGLSCGQQDPDVAWQIRLPSNQQGRLSRPHVVYVDWHHGIGLQRGWSIEYYLDSRSGFLVLGATWV